LGSAKREKNVFHAPLEKNKKNTVGILQDGHRLLKFS
jgi:hypothetical protein